MIGLGKMGANMARRLARSGHRVVAYNRTPEKALALADEEPNVVAVTTLEEIAAQLPRPRAVWVMVPAGDAGRTSDKHSGCSSNLRSPSAQS